MVIMVTGEDIAEVDTVGTVAVIVGIDVIVGVPTTGDITNGS